MKIKLMLVFFVLLVSAVSLYFFFFSDEKIAKEAKKGLKKGDLTQKVVLEAEKAGPIEIEKKKRDEDIPKVTLKKGGLTGTPIKGEALKKAIKGAYRKSQLKREIAEEGEQNILEFGGKKFEILKNYSAVDKKNYDTSMGLKVKDLGRFVIFLVNQKYSGDLNLKNVVKRTNGGVLGVITGNMMVEYVDYSLKGEIEQKYELVRVAEFSHLSYYEEDVDSLYSKNNSLLGEANVKKVSVEVFEHEIEAY